LDDVYENTSHQTPNKLQAPSSKLQAPLSGTLDVPRVDV